ncbi:MAG: DUF7017 domain-containing protein [Bacteroidales bacterium]
MSYKEVTNLRKAGNIDQAYEMAMQDFQHEANKWSASALFWVLNQQCKSLLESDQKESITEKFEEMNNLYVLMDDEDGIALNSLDILRRKCNSEYSNIIEAIQLSKNKQNKEAVDLFHQVYTKGALSKDFHESYGWAIFKYLLSEIENMDSRTSRTLLHDYIELHNPRPSQLHSLVLIQALRIAALHEEFKLIPFFRMWGLDNFTSEDWLPVQKEDHTYPPRAQKVLDKLFEAAKAAHFKQVDDLLPLFAEGAERLTDAKFAKRKYAIMLNALGRKEESYRLYLEMIKTLNEWYIWHEIAMLTDDNTIRLSCLCKALSKNKNEDFIGELRLHTAEVFLALGYTEEAQRELYYYNKNRELKRWSKSDTFKRLVRQIAIPEQLTKKETDYLSFTSKCEELIYHDLPVDHLILVSTYRDKEDKVKCRLADKSGDLTLVVQQKRYPELLHANQHDIFECRILKDGVGTKTYYKALTLHKVETLHPEVQPYYIQNGTVVYFNQEKKHYKVMLHKDQYCYFSANQINEKWRIGDAVSIDFIYRKEFKENVETKKLNVIRAQKSHSVQSPFVKEVEGELKVIDKNDGTNNQSFGFIDNCYIPAELLKPYLHLKGSTLKAKALPDGDKWQIFEFVDGVV